MPEWLFIRAPLGTNVELCKMDFVYQGAPFVYVPAKTSVDLPTMDYPYQGAPFVSYARG